MSTTLAPTPTLSPTLTLFGGEGSPSGGGITEVSDDFSDYLRVERNSSEHTIMAYRKDLRDLVDFLGDVDVDQITMGDLRAFLKMLHQRQYCSATIGRKLAALRSFLVFAQREGLITVNHARALRSPKIEERLPHHLDMADMETLLKAPGSDSKGIRDKALLETLYSAGLRVSELVGLDVGCIDLGAKTVRVIGKGNRERLAPIGGPAADALKACVNDRTTGPVFLNYLGNRLSVRGIRKILAGYLKVVGLDPKTTPHTLRHSFATHMLDGGADIRAVQEMLGHKSITSTQIYTHVSVNRQRAVHGQCHPRG